MELNLEEERGRLQSLIDDPEQFGPFGGRLSAQMKLVQALEQLEQAREDIISLGIWLEHQGDYGIHEYLYECRGCLAKHVNKEDIIHEKDCCVLNALKQQEVG
ncbi:hypothetical protein [Litorivivens sp.]|uniref:hypothetical protein n=1 Tax=Litorivivens sp. TaxID=2020868 RepID=UPI003566974B